MADTPPKLFISYSWTDPQHEQWVVDLAEKLVASGVDVKLDKWDLGVGQDAIVFMEQMVTDSTIRKVLMIVDKNYAEKADAREGGVGTETQIISKEMYDDQQQDKFAALVLDKNDKGNVYLPAYYKSRIYIDFSEPQNHEKEFEKLLRWIFDKPLHVKPAIGKQPAFLSDETRIEILTTIPFRHAIEAIEESKGNASGRIEKYLETLSVGIESFRIKEYEGEFDDAVIESIESFLPYRTEFIELISTIARYGKIDDYIMALHEFFETLIPYLYLPKGFSGEYNRTDQDNFKFIIHELFLYTVAIFLKSEKFDAVHYLISNKYYVESYIRQHGSQMASYREFCRSVDSIDRIRNSRQEPKRISLHADILKGRTQYAGIDFKHLMQADFVLFMRAELVPSDDEFRGWHPIPLAHIGWSYHGVFEMFARAESIRYFDRIKHLFNITKKEDMIPLFDNYASGESYLPRWGIRGLNPKSLMNFDKLATTP